MSGPSYQVWLRDIASDASHLDLTDYLIELEWVRVASEVGSFSCILPESFPKEYLNLDTHLDWRVEIWRRPDEASPLKLENIGLIRRVTKQTDEEGRTGYVLSGPDVMHILKRRCVFPTKTNFTTSQYAVDHMRGLVRSQLISAVDTFHIADSPYTDQTVKRSLPTTCGWTLSCEADTATGDSLGTSLQWSWHSYFGQNLLDSLKRIYMWSTDPLYARTHLYFTVDFDDYKTWVFRVHGGRIGIDHSGNSGQPVIIGLDYGNLTIPVMDYDRSEESNACFTWNDEGGLDYLGHYAMIDTARANHSPINHMEICEKGTWEVSHQLNSDMFRRGRNYRKLTAKIVNGPGCAYGREWAFGDELVVSYLGEQYEADVIGIRARLKANGDEEMETMLDIPPV